MPPDRLTVLYTACLRGQLEALPRLYTLIKRERATVRGPSITLDLGASCVPDSWPCEVTGGRAALVAMDSMGYDAFYIDRGDPLASDPVTFDKLQNTILTPLVTDDRSLTLVRHGLDGRDWKIRLAGEHDGQNTADSALLTIRLSRSVPSAESTRYDAARHTVYLADQWDMLQVGRLEVDLTDERITLYVHRVLTPDLPPDPTVSSVVDFVAAEAQYASRRGKP